MRYNSVLAALVALTACSGGAGTRAASALPAVGPVAYGSYDTVGYATWYGEELAGHRTASGARFDPAAITAAHRTLPLNSFVEVTALDSGRTILVLINDRGPGRRDREIDLSRGAAKLLGVDRNPLAAVRIRSVSSSLSGLALRAGARTPVLAAAAASVAPQAAPIVFGDGPYVVEVAAFSNKHRARDLAKALDGEAAKGDGVWRVRLGPFDRLKAAQRTRDAMAARGYGDARITTSD